MNAMQLEHEIDRKACDLAQSLLRLVYQGLKSKTGAITRKEIDDAFCELLPCSKRGKEILKGLNPKS